MDYSTEYEFETDGGVARWGDWSHSAALARK